VGTLRYKIKNPTRFKLVTCWNC